MPNARKIKYRQVIDKRDHNEFTDCSKCKADLRNGPVPRSEKRFFGEHTHYSKLEGLYLDPEVNIVTHWRCPFCGHTIPRFA